MGHNWLSSLPEQAQEIIRAHRIMEREDVRAAEAECKARDEALQVACRSQQSPDVKHQAAVMLIEAHIHAGRVIGNAMRAVTMDA